MRLVSGVIMAGMLSACASMSESECLTADWGAIGYEDGSRGATVSAVTSRRQACAKKAGITVDMDAYLAGRQQGLRQFCTPTNAYSLGSRGGAYYGVCNGPEEEEFVYAYEAGKQLYYLESNVARAANAIQQAHSDLRAAEHNIAHTEAALISPKTPMRDRPGLLVDLKEYSKEKGRIETAIIALNRDHVRAQEDLDDYRADLAYNGPYLAGVSAPRNAGY